MIVFLSWSGPLSERLAEVFRTWIPSAIQTVRPYFSPRDIDKGARWSSEITEKLNLSSVCIIFLTRENLESSWIMFEAGAISKSVDSSKVCPILFDIEPTDVRGPLSQFQLTKFGKPEIKQLFNTINSSQSESRLDDSVAETVFEKWWPDLSESVDAILRSHKENGKNGEEIRSERELIEEILILMRNVTNSELFSEQPKDANYEDSLYSELMDLFLRSMNEVVLSQEEGVKLNTILSKTWKSVRFRKNIPVSIRAGILHDLSIASKSLNVYRPQQGFFDNDEP